MPDAPAGNSVPRHRRTKQQLIEEIEALERALGKPRRGAEAPEAAWLRAIFEFAPMEIALKDSAGRIVAISGNVAEYFDRKSEDFIGCTTADFLPEHIASVYMAADARVMETGVPSQQEVREEIDGRGIRYSLSSKFPMRDDKGVVTGICSLTTDITDLKQSEEALRVAHDNLEKQVEERTRELREQEKDLLDAQKIGHLGSYVFDHQENRLISFSKEFARVHGVSVDDITGPLNMNVDHLTHPDDWATVEAAYNASWENREAFEAEYRIIRPDGEIRHILEIGDYVHDVDGAATKLKGVVQDITERSLLDRAKVEFISTVSHELRTPLTSIKGSLGLIKSGVTGELPEHIRVMLDIAYSNSDRLVVLINDILDMEKIEAGQMTYRMKPVDVAAFMDEAMAANRGYGDTHNIRFVYTANDDDAMMVNADADRLMQVMSNLMSNAAKFSPEGDTVTLSTTRHGDTVRIAVADHGPGISEDFRESIFEKFTQADSTDARQVGGTGLGLTITRSIVARHGGSIDFETETDPQKETGTTFTIDLPALKG